MTTLRLDPAPETTHDVFSRDHAPVLSADPGDTRVLGSLDASGYLARQTFPGERREKMFAEPRGHCLTGPVEGDGGVGGTAIECPMTTELTVDLITGDPAARPLAGVHAETPAASTCVDLRVTQVANQTWGVHAVLPDGVLS